MPTHILTDQNNCYVFPCRKLLECIFNGFNCCLCTTWISSLYADSHTYYKPIILSSLSIRQIIRKFIYYKRTHHNEHKGISIKDMMLQRPSFFLMKYMKGEESYTIPQKIGIITRPFISTIEPKHCRDQLLRVKSPEARMHIFLY